jgi:cytochrome P450
MRFFERYGPLFRIRLPLGHELVVLAHPDAVEQVLRSRHENYVKGSVYDGARLLLGNGLVTSEGDFWLRQRALASPAFRPAKLERYLVTMGECTRRLVGAWERQGGGNIDAQDAMTRLTMEIVGQTLFGLDLSQHSDRARNVFDTALAAIGRRGPANLQVPLWVPTPGNLRFRHALRDLDALVYDIIGRFRSEQAVGADHTLLGAYVSARDPDTGEGMNDRQLRDEVVTLYLAGHETTASLLTWALYLLGRRADVAERVTAEIDAQVPDDRPSMDRLKGLQYTSQFLNEVLRLYPPAWTIARNAVAGDVVLGYCIPAGAMVMLSPQPGAPVGGGLAGSKAFRPRALRARGREGQASLRLFSLQPRSANLHRHAVRPARGATRAVFDTAPIPHPISAGARDRVCGSGHAASGEGHPCRPRSTEPRGSSVGHRRYLPPTRPRGAQMLGNPSSTTRVAIGKGIGLLIGPAGFILLPSFLPEAGWLARWGILLWYTTVGAIIGVFGVYAWHSILESPMPWRLRAPLLGAWIDFVLTSFASDPLQATVIARFGGQGLATSAFGFTADGAVVGLVIGDFATRFGGEGEEAVAGG